MEHVESHTGRLLGTVPAQSMKSTAFRFFPGDVLYGRLRPYLNKVYLADAEGLCSSEFIVLPPCEAVLPKLLSYRLRHSSFVEFANHQNQGDRPRVSFDQISPYQILLPPKKEQDRIVAKLEELLGQVDACQKRLERIPLFLKRFRQSVLAAACSGRLTGDWRDKNPDKLSFPTRFPASQNEAEGIEELEVPKSWRAVKLGTVSAIRGGIQKTPLRRPRKNKFPYLRVANVYRGYLRLEEIEYFELEKGELERWSLKPGDVLIVEGNGSPKEIGRCSLWQGEIPNCVHQNHIIRCRPIQGVMGEFILSFLNSNTGIREMMMLSSSTSGLHTLSVSKVGSITIPIAPPQEQVEIARRVRGLFKLANQIESRYNAAKASLDHLTQAIFAKAFRGELVPQEPKDEPASALLVRMGPKDYTGKQHPTKQNRE